MIVCGSNSMITFISRVQNLSPAVKHVKLGDLGSRFFSAFQRTLYASGYLTSSVLIYKQKSEPLHRKNHRFSERIPKNLGKTVELDEDLNEIITSEKILNVKRKEEIQSEPSETEGVNLENTRKISGSRKSFKSMDRNAYLLSSIISKLKTKRQREKNQEFVLEGKRLINEAIIAGVIPQKIFFTRTSDIENLNLPEKTEIFRIPYKVCQLWADSVTPQGIIGIFKIPNLESLRRDSGDCIPLTIICDNIRDPGNLGSVLRVVAGVGCEKLILTKGCVGMWEQKVLRASAGAHFQLPILKNMTWTDIENEISETSQVFLADSSIEVDDKRVDITFRNINKKSEELPISCYFSLEFQKKSTVFVLGGETEGLSDEAYEFAIRRSGTRVYIPLNAVESLNVAVALGILAFDFKRQLNGTSKNTLLHQQSTADCESNGS